MRIVRKLAVGLSAVALMGSLATPGMAFEKLGDRTPTVGDFLTAYARALNIELPASAEPSTVAAALQASGVKLGTMADPASVLTQAEVVNIAHSNGLRVTTHAPLKVFTGSEIEQFFVTYGPVLGRSTTATPRIGTQTAAMHFRKERAKGKGHKSPKEPNDHSDDHH